MRSSAASPVPPQAASPVRSSAAGLPRRRRWLAVAAAALAVPVGATMVIMTGALGASATTVPGPPPGWTTTFGDSFSGAAGSGADSGWTYDTGTQYSGTGCTGNCGTGEVESNTSSAANVAEDGSGHLNITPGQLRRILDIGPHRDQVSDSFAAPAGGEMEVTASIKQPNPSSGLGYWPAFWMLGAGFRASGAGTSGTMDCSNWPSPGEIDVMENVNALTEHSGTLHCGTDPGGPCNETTGLSSGLQACSGCQTGYNTYSVIVNRTNTSNESITWYLNGNAVLHGDREQGRHRDLAGGRRPRLLPDPRPGHRRRYPNAICGCTPPSASTSSGAAMSVGYVAVYQTSGSTGSPSPSPASASASATRAQPTPSPTSRAAAARPAPPRRPPTSQQTATTAARGTIAVTAATGDANPPGVDGNQAAQLANGD